MKSFEHELSLISHAATRAARLCVAVRQQMIAADAMEKAGREPVTIADYGSQAIILQMIAANFPNDQVFAEERAVDFRNAASESQREAVTRFVSQTLESSISQEDIAIWLDFGRDRRSNRVWAIDPIDGTKGFLRGEQFAIAIALIVDGKPAVSALACPMLPYEPDEFVAVQGVLATAIRGQGATLQPLDGSASRPLRVSTRTRGSEARVVESVESGHSDHGFSASVLAAAGIIGQPVRMDSQAKYVAVADGRADLYIRHSVGEGYAEKIWDHAAGVLIVEEAGGRVTDLNGAMLDFSQGERLSANHGILAANDRLHGPALTAVRQTQRG